MAKETRRTADEETGPWYATSRLRLVFGALLVGYGLYSFVAGRAYLPGLWRAEWAVTGTDGLTLSLAYVVLGLFLLLRRDLFKQYVLGLGLGPLGAVYGAYALMAGESYLPGLRGGAATVTGAHGRGVAVAYLVGGVYLICREFIEKHVHDEWTRTQLYFFQNLLLVILIGILVYVLLNVGTAGGLAALSSLP
jgi:hypothetical protein